MKEKSDENYFKWSPGNIQRLDSREGEKKILTFSANVKVTRFTLGRTQNFKLFPASHAQMIIWIFPESLRSPSTSLSSLLKVPSVESSASPE